MLALLCFVLAVLVSPFKARIRLEAENAVLRHQLIVLRRKVQGRVPLTNNDRWFFIQLYRWFPSILQVLAVVRPETLVHWHRAGFRRYWRWRSRSRGGRPPIETDLRGLIQRMNRENPLWGSPRIHGELLKLGFVSPSRPSPSTWSSDADHQARAGAPFCATTRRTFAAIDMFVVPTIGYKPLYGIVIMRLDRRRLVWTNATPTAEWIARQITEAFPWDEAPLYLLRDRDRSYGAAVRRRLQAMGIRDHHQGRRGRMAMSNGSSDQSGASASTTLWSR
jgi:hypothetical protein